MDFGEILFINEIQQPQPTPIPPPKVTLLIADNDLTNSYSTPPTPSSSDIDNATSITITPNTGNESQSAITTATAVSTTTPHISLKGKCVRVNGYLNYVDNRLQYCEINDEGSTLTVDMSMVAARADMILGQAVSQLYDICV